MVNWGSHVAGPDRRQQLIAFLSADMANATDFKSRHQSQYVDGTLVPPTWPRYFSEVFNRVLQKFDEELRQQRFTSTMVLSNTPRLWKINGDELLFRELVIPGEDGLKWLALVASAFVQTVTRIDAEILADGCGLKGCIWTAGFPIRNKEIRVPTGQTVPIIRADTSESTLPDFDTGAFFRDEEGLVDYLGPDMDLGFRLAAIAPPGRVICSIDVAYLLMQRAEAPNLYHVGWRVLKGVGGGAPYPVFWISSADDQRPRHPWEDRESGELKEYLNSRPLQRDDFLALSEAYWSQLRDYFQRPYRSPDEITPEHGRLWQIVAENDTSEFDPVILDQYPQY
jgi:hypothetical protein